jgi:hypothetical protein
VQFLLAGTEHEEVFTAAAQERFIGKHMAWHEWFLAVQVGLAAAGDEISARCASSIALGKRDVHP